MAATKKGIVITWHEKEGEGALQHKNEIFPFTQEEFMGEYTYGKPVTVGDVVNFKTRIEPEATFIKVATRKDKKIARGIFLISQIKK